MQDLSSQQTGGFFKPKRWDSWWDACAASGGKSLLLHEDEPNIKLVVSDIRESVLANLDERFQLAGLTKYQKKVLDLTANIDQSLHDYEFDGIILRCSLQRLGHLGPYARNDSPVYARPKLSFFSACKKV